MQDAWNRVGIDTLHLSFKTAGNLSPRDLVMGLAELLDQIGLDGDFNQRDRGRNGFECGLSFGKLIELDWTDAQGSGPNKGTASAQLKGELFGSLGSAEVAVMGLMLDELGPAKCTRIDAQVTHCGAPLAGFVIGEFRAGRIACPRKKYFEPKGQELEGGRYPKGATLALGSRQSESYGRMYDKHLEAKGDGPQRLRAEVELKGKLANEAWKSFLAAWRHEAITQPPQLVEEVKLSQRLVRTYMPLRDVSQWSPQDRPKNWAGRAPEPAWWAEMFQAKAERLRIEKEPTKALRQAIARSERQMGGRFTQGLMLTERDLVRRGICSEEEAPAMALRVVRGRLARHASEARLLELLENTPKEEHAWLKDRWFQLGKIGGDCLDSELDEGLM